VIECDPIRRAGRNVVSLMSETVINDGNWHRIGLTWDGTFRTLIVDDVIVAQDTQNNNLQSQGNNIYIGCGDAVQPSTFFSGMIDDV